MTPSNQYKLLRGRLKKDPALLCVKECSCSTQLGLETMNCSSEMLIYVTHFPFETLEVFKV